MSERTTAEERAKWLADWEDANRIFGDPLPDTPIVGVGRLIADVDTLTAQLGEAVAKEEGYLKQIQDWSDAYWKLERRTISTNCANCECGVHKNEEHDVTADDRPACPCRSYQPMGMLGEAVAALRGFTVAEAWATRPDDIFPKVKCRYCNEQSHTVSRIVHAEDCIVRNARRVQRLSPEKEMR